MVYKAPSGKCVIGVKPPNSNGVREVDERSPLIPGKHVPVDGEGNCEDTGSGCGLLRGRGTDITFLAILVCSFLSAFDFTVIAAIFPLMYVPPSLLPPQLAFYLLSFRPSLVLFVDSSGSDFQSLNKVSWIAVAYIISNTAFQALYGRLSDIFGRKTSLLLANVIFLLGTIGCAVSPSLWTLTASRMVAGIGGGGLSVMVPIPNPPLSQHVQLSITAHLSFSHSPRSFVRGLT